MEQWRVLGCVHINNYSLFKSLVDLQSKHSKMCGEIALAFKAEFCGALVV